MMPIAVRTVRTASSQARRTLLTLRRKANKAKQLLRWKIKFERDQASLLIKFKIKPLWFFSFERFFNFF